jgi:hypothetical protein
MLADRSNKELLDMIILDKERLGPDQLAAAENEFKKRNISNDEVVEMLKAYGLVLPKSGEYGKEKLGFIGKAFSFLFPGLLYIFYIGKIRSNLFSRRANDVRLWTTYGIGFYVIIILIIQILLLMD